MAAKPLLIRLSIREGLNQPSIIHPLGILPPSTAVDNRDLILAVTGGGVTTFTWSTNRTYSNVITGGGIVAVAGRKGGFGTVTATGGGVVVEVGRKGAIITQAMTGGGVVTLTDRKGAITNVTPTGGGVVTLRDIKGGQLTLTTTGGGIVTIDARAALSGGGTNIDAVITVAGGGVVVIDGYKSYESGNIIRITDGIYPVFAGLDPTVKPGAARNRAAELAPEPAFLVDYHNRLMTLIA